MTQQDHHQKPDHVFRARRGISAAVWRRERTTQDGQTMQDFSISIDKRFQDKAGDWKSSKSFFADDLPHVELVVRKAFEYVTLKREQDAEELGS